MPYYAVNCMTNATLTAILENKAGGRGMIDLSIVIVNHNTRKMLLECLESIFGRPQSISYEVIVVDNESSDGSVEAVQTQFPQVKLIVNPIGRYFSAGNNQGIAVA